MLKERPLGYPKSALGNYMLFYGKAHNAGFIPHLLGFDTFFPIIIFSRKYKKQKSNKCIDVLTHGDEVAPFFALLGLLTILGSNFGEDVNLSFLLKNPTGFALGTRNDVRGNNPNRGYIENKERKLPLIGNLVEVHQNRILNAGADGYLSMHEDSDIPDNKKNGGVFVYTQNPRSEKMAHKLLTAAAPVLGIVSGDMLKKLNKYNQKDTLASPGIVREGPDSDSSLENKLSRKGLPTLTTETPSLEVSLPLRIIANAKMIKSFAK